MYIIWLYQIEIDINIFGLKYNSRFSINLNTFIQKETHAFEQHQ